MADDDDYTRIGHVDEHGWCPTCDPRPPGSPSVGPHVVYCVRHTPAASGVDDDAVRGYGIGSSTGGADGRDCRAFARLITRKS